MPHRNLFGSWLSWMLWITLVFFGLALLFSAEPPMPPEPVTVTLSWTNAPADQEVTAYYVRQATNITGPWTVVVATTNTQRTITLPSQGRWFWFVTASNFWGESIPSNTNSTPIPAGKVQDVKLTR
jgi:hypothetical protein